MVQLGRGGTVVVGVGYVLVIVGVVDPQTPLHISVGVQKALVGQEEDGPTSQAIVGRFEVPGGSGLVVMHCPPQGAVGPFVQYWVGVHVEPVGQALL